MTFAFHTCDTQFTVVISFIINNIYFSRYIAEDVFTVAK